MEMYWFRKLWCVPQFFRPLIYKFSLTHYITLNQTANQILDLIPSLTNLQNIKCEWTLGLDHESGSWVWALSLDPEPRPWAWTPSPGPSSPWVWFWTQSQTWTWTWSSSPVSDLSHQNWFLLFCGSKLGKMTSLTPGMGLDRVWSRQVLCKHRFGQSGPDWPQFG